MRAPSFTLHLNPRWLVCVGWLVACFRESGTGKHMPNEEKERRSKGSSTRRPNGRSNGRMAGAGGSLVLVPLHCTVDRSFKETFWFVVLVFCFTMYLYDHPRDQPGR
jgi:hypothetical protein